MNIYLRWLTAAEYTQLLVDADALPTANYARQPMTGPKDTTDHGDRGRNDPPATTTQDPAYELDSTTMGPHEEIDNGSGVYSQDD